MSVLLSNILRASPVIVAISSIFSFLISSKFIYLRFFAYFIATELLSQLIKFGLSRFTTQFLYRPALAGNCYGCKTFLECPQVCTITCVDESKHIGMPSGHCMDISMAATFWILWIWRQSNDSFVVKIIKTVVMVIGALAVIFSRIYVENCHTFPQVIVGTILGSLLGTGFYFADEFLSKKF